MFSGFMHITGAVVPVFVLIGLGAAFRRYGLMDEVFTGRLNKFIFWVATPALLFDSLIHADITQAFDLKSVAASLTLTAVVAALLYTITPAFHMAPERRGVFIQGCFRGNLAFIGLAVLMGAYGRETLAPASVLIGCITPMFNIAGVFVLVMPHHNREDGLEIKPLVKEILTNPLLLSCLAGIVLGLLHVKLPFFVDQPVELISQTALPLALITVGSSLDFHGLKSNLNLTLLTALIKLIIVPAAIFIILHFTGSSLPSLRVAVVLMATPTAVASYIMAHQMRGDSGLAAAIVTGTTLFSLVTLTGWLFILQ